MRTRELLPTILLSLFLLSCSGQEEEPARRTLRVGVAASLGPSVHAFADSLDRTGSEIKLEVSTAGSNAIVRQAIAGAPFDILLLASSSLMDQLVRAGAIVSRRVVGTNRLCLVVPDGAPPLDSLADLSRPTIQRIGIGSPGVPAGDYAREVLTAARLLEPLTDRFIFGTNVRQVLTWVEKGEVDCGFVYVSDTAGAEDLRIAFVVDERLHAPIQYEGAVMRGSRYPKDAGWLLEELGRAISGSPSP